MSNVDSSTSMSIPFWRKNPSDARLKEELVEQEHKRSKFDLTQNRKQHSDMLHSVELDSQKAKDGPSEWTAPRSGFVKLDVYGSELGGYDEVNFSSSMIPYWRKIPSDARLKELSGSKLGGYDEVNSFSSTNLWRKLPSHLKELVEEEHKRSYYIREKFDHLTQYRKERPDMLELSKQLHSRSIKEINNKVKKKKVQKAEDGPSECQWTAYEWTARWTAPLSGFVKLEVSGSKSGGYGFTLRDCDAKLIAAVSGVAKPESLPLLYYQLQGVEKGLQHALRLGFPKVFVTIHSLYAVTVAEGSSTVALMDCHMEVFSTIEQIKKLKSRFEEFLIDSRSNRAAKYLSELHKEANFCRVEEMPWVLRDIIEDDARQRVPHT
ncbi:hypothetical protein ACHQM5_024599 [Ranunculus cassubicifolius]